MWRRFVCGVHRLAWRSDDNDRLALLDASFAGYGRPDPERDSALSGGISRDLEVVATLDESQHGTSSMENPIIAESAETQAANRRARRAALHERSESSGWRPRIEKRVLRGSGVLE